MTRHMYRNMIYTELLKVDPSKLIAALLDLEKAHTLNVESRTIDTHEALERICTDLGFAIVIHEETLHLTEMI